MDFLDPKKQKAHTIRLLIGYVFVGVALLIATIILLYQAYGFGIGQNGQVIQNGLVFVSSQPDPADIYVNGKLDGSKTNTRLVLPAGQYTFELQRAGYNTWQRAVSVNGGSVEHFDYPLLIPSKLVTTVTKKYDGRPEVVSQSPNQQWLVVSAPDDITKFDLFNLNSIKDGAKTLTLPTGLLSTSTNAAADTLQAVAWSADNNHLLLEHTYQKGGQMLKEYIMLDTQDPTQSLNLTSTLALGQADQLSLHDQAYDQYYIYNTTAQTLKTVTLKSTAQVAYLDHVAAFKTYGSNMVLYADDSGAASQNQLTVKLRQGNDTYTLRTVPTGTQYLLQLAQYSGDWYVAVGASSENKVDIYKNPVATLSNAGDVLVPAAVLKVTGPTYVAFSTNTQFVMAENATSFAVYDAENEKSYAYQMKLPLDTPQAHATWMDGDRISYVSNGKVEMFDFDSTNVQTLAAADPDDVPLFDRPYKFLYTIAPQIAPATPTTPATTTYSLTSTSLLIPADQ